MSSPSLDRGSKNFKLKICNLKFSILFYFPSAQNGFHFSSGGGGVSRLTMISVKIEAMAAGKMM